MSASTFRPRWSVYAATTAAVVAAAALSATLPPLVDAFSPPPPPQSFSPTAQVARRLSRRMRPSAADASVEDAPPQPAASSSSSSATAAALDDKKYGGVEYDKSSVSPAAAYGRTFESLLADDGGDSSSSAGLRDAEEMLLRTVDQYKSGGSIRTSFSGVSGGVSVGEGNVKPTDLAFRSVIEEWLVRAGRGSASSSSSSSSSTAFADAEKDTAAEDGKESKQDRDQEQEQKQLASDVAAEAASRAEALLDKMEELYEPDGELYSGLVSAWCSVAMRAHADREAEAQAAKDEREENEEHDEDGRGAGKGAAAASLPAMNSRTAALRAMAILDRMERLHGEIGSEDLLPGLSTYATLQAMWRTLGEGSDAVPDADRYLAQVRQRRDAVHPSVEDDGVSSRKISSHGDAMQILGRLDSADEVRRKLAYGRRTVLLRRGGRKVEHRTRRGIAPITVNYNILIDALAKSGKHWAGQRAEDVLDYMVRRHRSGPDGDRDDLKPDVLTINSVVDAWARSPVPDSAERAESVLDKLRNWQLEGVLVDIHPDAATYNALINAWCLLSSHAADAAEKAERVLAEMEELYDADPGGDSSVRLDAVSYASVLRAWAQQCARDGSDPAACAERAERVFQRMHDRHTADPDANAAPDTRCFNALLDVHANGRGTVSGQRAMKTLKLMEDFANAGNELVRPDRYTYNTVIKALGNGRGSRAADRALDLLERMERWSAEGGDDKERLRPDAVTYNTVIDAFARRGDRPSALIAERLLKRMDRGGRDGGRGSGSRSGGATPNARTVAGVMNAWALSGERNSARVAEAIFEKFCNVDRGGFVVPDAVVYNTLLNAWAKSGDRSAAQRAMDLLDRMEKDYEGGNIDAKPNVKTYTSALDALAKSQQRWAPRQSEEILGYMERSYLAGEDESIRPNALSYTAVMNCWARSRDRNKAVRAQNLFHRMEEQYRRGNGAARPNVVAYNVLLNACAHTPQPRDSESFTDTAADEAAVEEAFKIACLSFDELRTSKHVRPTHISYATFLNVCANLMPEGDLRDDLVQRIFRRCRGDGMASDLVLRRLRSAVSSLDLYERLLEGRDEDHLPSEWSKNVSYRLPDVLT